MPHCATTVPAAEPAMPQPKPYRKSALSAAFAANPTPATTSGVRVSCRPRSSPVAAMTINIPGRPISETER
jgi:hypothetical protein